MKIIINLDGRKKKYSTCVRVVLVLRYKLHNPSFAQNDSRIAFLGFLEIFDDEFLHISFPGVFSQLIKIRVNE